MKGCVHFQDCIHFVKLNFYRYNNVSFKPSKLCFYCPSVVQNMQEIFDGILNIGIFLAYIFNYTRTKDHNLEGLKDTLFVVSEEI